MYNYNHLYFIDGAPCEFRYFDAFCRMYFFQVIDSQETIVISEGREDKVIDITAPWVD